jgi:putative hemolysin
MLNSLTQRIPLIKNPFNDLSESMEVLSTFMKSSPYLEIRYETKNYRLKTADRLDEFHKIFKFRYDVFVGECHGTSEFDNIDIDQYDTICDHLIIQDKTTDDVVGYYRVLSSAFTKNFYSENEFCLDTLKSLSGNKLELGRACIHQAHRNGQVLSLLWKGIGKYCLETQTRYLFGCSSVHSESISLAHQIYHSFKVGGKIETSFKVRALGDFKMNVNFDQHPHIYEEDFANESIPSLLKSYLSAGAMIAGEPALDREFSCIDFLTVLDLTKLSPSFKRRYFNE